MGRASPARARWKKIGKNLVKLELQATGQKLRRVKYNTLSATSKTVGHTVLSFPRFIGSGKALACKPRKSPGGALSIWY
jgi:hypothetical protein